MRQRSVVYRRRQTARRFRYTVGRRLRFSQIRTIVLLACVAGLIASGIKLFGYLADSKKSRATNDAVAQMYHTEDGQEPIATVDVRLGVTAAPFVVETPAPSHAPGAFQTIASSPLPEFKDLLKINPDVIGWLNIKGELDLPVVYRNNDYYLTRDVYQKKSSGGALFLDQYHPLKASAQYLLIHGHNMKDGSMFGKLQRFLTLDYLQKHCIFEFDTLYQKGTYVVYAVLILPENMREAGYISYEGFSATPTQKQFGEFVQGLKTRSRFSIPVKVGEGDALLALSTCMGKERLVVAARRVRPNESVSDLKQLMGFAFKK